MTQVANRIVLDTIPEFKLRPDDELECLAGGMTGDIAVRRSVAGASQAYAQYIDGDLVCLWGWRWRDYATGSVTAWLLSTEAADKHKVAFGRLSKRLLRVLHSRINTITVLVHVKHDTAIKWLEWLGFTRSRTMTENFIEMKKEK